MIRVFRGRKGASGGGEAPPPPTRTPDNLRSIDTIEALLSIGEGPNKGLVDGAKTFFIGETQLVNNNDEENFQNFELTEFQGQVPEVIHMTLGGTARSQNVNVTLFNGTPVVRQTLFGDIDFFDVRIIITRLYLQNDSGVFNHDIEFKLEYRALSAPTWTNAFQDEIIKIHGKTTSNFVKEFRIPVARISEPYEIRLTKISPESDTTTSFRDMVWESLQEVVATETSFENLHVVKLVGQASDQFSSIPDFKGIYDGRMVQIPSNYDPIAHTTSGLWDGTFKIDWTNSGPWCLHDFVTNDRYGMNAYFPVAIDKWDIFEAAAWCDQQVPDGKGGTHPRWTFNSYISDARNGKEMARFIAGTFNGTFFDDLNGTVRLRVDKDDPAKHIFTPENISDDGFEYSYTELTTRYNDIIVSFTNPDLNWIEDRRRVFNQADIDLNGRIPLEFIAVGATNEREALRRGTYKLITALTEKEIVKFRTNRLGQYVQPWDIMLIGDPDMGYSLTGRIKVLAPDRLSFTLRDPVFLEVGINYTLRGVSPSGGVFERMVTAPSTGYVTEMGVDSALPADVPDLMTFSLEQTGAGFGAPKPYRVISAEEVDGDPDNFEIEGIEINRNKWNDVDNLTFSGEVQFSFLPTPFVIPSPTEVHFHSAYFRGVRENHLTIRPILDRIAYPYYNEEFDVYSRPADQSDIWRKWTLANGDTIIDHPSGAHEFRILPHNFFGAMTPLEYATTFNFNVVYTVDPPAVVQNFIHNTTYAGLVLAWDLNPEPDIEFYEIREGLSWDSGEVVVTGVPSNRFIVPKKKIGDVTFHIAAYAAGKYSLVPTALSLSILPPATVQDFQAVQNIDTIVFRWTPNDQPDIGDYIIREGPSWGTGRKVAQVTGTQWSMPSNIPADRSFWIKASDKSGNLSVNAAQAVTPVVPTEQHNLWVALEEADSGFPNHKVDLEMDLSGFLSIPDGKYYGEYVFPIDLIGEVYARNIYRSNVDVVVDDNTTWDAATFSWDSPSADRPWEQAGDSEKVQYIEYISLYEGLGSGDIEGFRLAGTLAGENGTFQSSSGGISYLPGRFMLGLQVQNGTGVAWPVAVPSPFKIGFWWRPKSVFTGVHTLLQLTDPAPRSLQVLYDSLTDEFVLKDSNLAELRVQGFGDMAPDDLIYFNIVQTATVRKLYVGRLQDGEVVSGQSSTAHLAGGYSTLGVVSTGSVSVSWVISDIKLTNGGDIQLVDFMPLVSRAAPPGYADFRLFLTGDYRYSRALIRQVMTTETSDRPRIRTLTYLVDVPDVIDRGAHSVPASQTTITFNKAFLIPPEIGVIFKSAQDRARVSLVSVTNTSFTFDVLNEIDSNVAAEITWVAHGY